MDGKKFFYKINCYFLFIRSLPQTSEMKIIIFHVIKILLWYTKSHKASHHANNKSDHNQIRVINISFLSMTIRSFRILYITLSILRPTEYLVMISKYFLIFVSLSFNVVVAYLYISTYITRH